MDYSKEHILTERCWNNAFWWEIRNWRTIRIAPIKYWNLNDIVIWDDIVFEEVDEKWFIISKTWLKEFIKFEYHWVPCVIFDNHNHSFYFWFEWIKTMQIKAPCLLIHIDEHSDMAKPVNTSKINLASNLEEVYNYTNTELNVWNFILPAIDIWLVEECKIINSEYSLDEINSYKWDWYILDLDLDFFSDNMEYINEEKKISTIRNLAKNASLITIATSPYFISQEKAISICKKIFSK